MDKNKTRVTVTLTDEEYQTLSHWSKIKQESMNEYIHDGISRQLDYDNHDFHTEDIMTAKMNQMVDAINALSDRISTVQHVVSLGFKSLMSVTRGDEYLFTDETSDEGGGTDED